MTMTISTTTTKKQLIFFSYKNTYRWEQKTKASVHIYTNKYRIQLLVNPSLLIKNVSKHIEIYRHKSSTTIAMVCFNEYRNDNNTKK